jgi:serine protease Do
MFNEPTPPVGFRQKHRRLFRRHGAIGGDRSSARRMIRCASVVASIFLCCGLVPASADTPVVNHSDLVARILPSVVSISVWATNQAQTTSPQARSQTPPGVRQIFGSGFIIDPAGIIVTNRHVLDGAVKITVGIGNTKDVPAKVIAQAGPADIALLRVAMPAPLPALQFGDSAQLRIGEPIMVAGNPLGVGISVSSGIVSSTNPDTKGNEFDDFIQTDAPINRGSSGGPIVDMQGNVIGIATSFHTEVGGGGSIGIGLAIASNDAKALVDNLLRNGRMQAGWLDLGLQNVTSEIAGAVGLGAARGAIVAGLPDKRLSDPAHPIEGDIILKFGTQEPTDARELVRAIAAMPIGQTIPVVVWRHGQEQTVSAQVAGWPSGGLADTDLPARAAPVGKSMLSSLGLSLAALPNATPTAADRSRHQNGAVVTKVDKASTASESGLAPGDIILQVQDSAVNNAADAEAAIAQAARRHQEFVVVLVRQKLAQRWIAMPLG